MQNDLTLQKLKNQLTTRANPIIAFIDFDGTLYTAGRTMWTAPYYNRKTSRLFNQFHIPYAIITGRADWGNMPEAELKAFGMKKPDIVITGAGTMIFYRNTEGILTMDTERFNTLHNSQFTWVDEKRKKHNEQWNKEKIIKLTQTHKYANYLRLSPEDDNKFVIRFSVRNMPIDLLENIKQELKIIFPKGIKILIAEKLLQKNTLHIYSGDMLLVPEMAGKEGAVEYLLRNYAKLLNKPLTAGAMAPALLRNGTNHGKSFPLSSENTPLSRVKRFEQGYKTSSGKEQKHGEPHYPKLHAYLFGDSSIDINMLMMPENKKYYFLSQYGVHLTPRAAKILGEIKEKNLRLCLVKDDGPHVIYHVFKQLLISKHFSPAQNSYARRLLYPFEKLINQTIYPNLTADEVSFKGLDLVIKSIDLLYRKNFKKPQRIKAMRQYLIGMALDAVDGIRARNSPPTGNSPKVDGQLIDVFCDRSKEFYQLYYRARAYSNMPLQTTNHKLQTNFYQTLLTAISCILPSIARAQTELSGTVVKEVDEHGGSMLQRSRRLLFSLLNDTFGRKNKSFVIDQEILKTNMATYRHRRWSINKPPDLQSPIPNLLTPFQKKAIERFLLLVQLLQEENQIIENALNQYPDFLKKYKKEFQSEIKKYLDINVTSARKNLQIIDPKLSLNSYL